MRPLLLRSTVMPVFVAALLAAPMIAAPMHQAAAQFGIGVSITVAPPELPIYEQPPLPEPGYMWTPGYWAYGPLGYYWVPGTWVEPPSVGLLWTPGYWGWNDGAYIFNQGYWGDHVGFYGGIDYGFGYGGYGYEGGEWRDGRFAYNSRVNNFGRVHVTNVYERNVTVNNGRRLAFNGPNGINVRPRAEELAVAHERHVQPTALQVEHVRMASQNRELLNSVNHGRPAITATPRPAAFSGRGAGPAGGAPGPHPVGGRMPEPGNAPHPGMAGPRPGTVMMQHPGAMGAPHPVASPHPVAAPHPGYQGARPGYAPHPANMDAPHAAPRPMQEPRPMPESRPMQAPHPMMQAPHPMMQAPRPMQAPHAPAPAPHPAAAPHPAGGPEKPHH